MGVPALTQEFDAAFAELAQARLAYEDQPRDPERIAALGAARIRLDEARAALDDHRRQLGDEPLWRIAPAGVEVVKPPPLWSIDQSGNA